VAINLLRDGGVPLEQQRFTWRDLVQAPYNKLTDDAFTRVRVILMNGIESEALRFSHARPDERAPAARAGPGTTYRAAPADHGELAQSGRSESAGNDDRLRAGRELPTGEHVEGGRGPMWIRVDRRVGLVKDDHAGVTCIPLQALLVCHKRAGQDAHADVANQRS